MTKVIPPAVMDDARHLLAAKKLVAQFHQALNDCPVNQVQDVLQDYTTPNYVFRSVYPFRDNLSTQAEVAQHFWKPLKESWTHLKRRTDLFFGGQNALEQVNPQHEHQDTNASPSFWIVTMGHFVGLLDADWLGVCATRQLTNLRFAQFDQVVFAAAHSDDNDAPTTSVPKIAQTFLSLDLVGLLQSQGLAPLPYPSTGRYFVYPGPSSSSGGLAYRECNAPLSEGEATQALVDRMVDDLTSINHWPADRACPRELLQRTWVEDMTWYGPAGIGATYTLERYQEQHQRPFRSQLTNKSFAGHAVRVAEGPYAAFFGWPCNLWNTPTGGFLGLPGLPMQASTTNNGTAPTFPMQVVDIYYREGSKLQENWVLIDLPWYLKSQGVDILERTTRLAHPTSTAAFAKTLSQIDKLSKAKTTDGSEHQDE